MSFTIVEPAEVIYEAITHAFSIENDEGRIFKLRKWEDSNGGGYYIEDENNKWVDFSPDEEMEEYILDELF
jgi:hypothetical protein